MAYKEFSSTKIYLDLRKLLDIVLDITPNFPRAYKFTVGDKMQIVTIELMSSVSSAYISREKNMRLSKLNAFQSDFETLKMLLRVSFERKWLYSNNIYARIIELTNSIGKQVTSWISYLTKESI